MLLVRFGWVRFGLGVVWWFVGLGFFVVVVVVFVVVVGGGGVIVVVNVVFVVLLVVADHITFICGQ